MCPTLLAPDVEEVTPRRTGASASVAASLASGLESTLRQGGALVIVDLDPVLGVQLAALWSQRRLANAVLVLPSWPYQQATLPVDGLLHALVAHAHRLGPPEDLPNAAFVLDARRGQRIVGRPPSDPRADNRYQLAVSDLPDLHALRTRGIRQLVKLAAT
jgi:hypothetical protein